MADQAGLCLEPLCALDAVVTPQSGQVFGGLGDFVLLEMLRGQNVGLDLVKIATQRQLEKQSQLRRHGGVRVFSYRVLFRVLTRVRLLPRPMTVFIR